MKFERRLMIFSHFPPWGCAAETFRRFNDDATKNKGTQEALEALPILKKVKVP